MTDWDKFFKTYDAKVETYSQSREREAYERKEHLEKLGYLAKIMHYRGLYGHSYGSFILRAIKTRKGKRGSKKEKESWVRF